MKEHEIKIALTRFLHKNSQPLKLKIIEEFKIAGGNAIADIVVVSDRIECFEIKSDSDSLNRLVRQGWHYGRVFDRVTLVSAPGHVNKAIDLIPSWWGIIQISPDSTLSIVRKSKPNPNIDHEGIAEVFSRDEAEYLLMKANALIGLKGKSLIQLRKRILEIYPVSKLKTHLSSLLKNRSKDLFLEHA